MENTHPAKRTASAAPLPAEADPTAPAGIAANVNAERVRRGMSMDGLAHRAGLSVHQLRRRLRGEATITAPELHRLSQALQVPATQLLDYPGPGLTTREVAK